MCILHQHLSLCTHAIIIVFPSLPGLPRPSIRHPLLSPSSFPSPDSALVHRMFAARDVDDEQEKGKQRNGMRERGYKSSFFYQKNTRSESHPGFCFVVRMFVDVTQNQKNRPFFLLTMQSQRRPGKGFLLFPEMLLCCRAVLCLSRSPADIHPLAHAVHEDRVK